MPHTLNINANLLAAMDDLSLLARTVVEGFFDGLHAAKKNNGKRIPIVGMNRFIEILCSWCFSNVSFCQVASLSQLAERLFKNWSTARC